MSIEGIATPFITCIPTEVSEHWFAGRQRTIITAVLGMGDCFGLILGMLHNYAYLHYRCDNLNTTISNSVALYIQENISV